MKASVGIAVTHERTGQCSLKINNVVNCYKLYANVAARGSILKQLINTLISGGNRMVLAIIC